MDEQVKILISQLTSLTDTRNVMSVRSIIYEILHLSTKGCDISLALPILVKYLAHQDAFVKRVVGEIMSSHAGQNPEMVLLATNTLVQDCKDVNPVVRGLSLRTMANIKSPLVTDVLSSAVASGLTDKNPYVTRSAAFVSSSLHDLSPDSVREGEIWDLLYRHLGDSDGQTVAACLCALEEIFSKETGVVMSNKLAQHLIDNLASVSPAVQRLLLQFLMKYSPKTKPHVFDCLNKLDSTLTQNSSLAVTFACLKVFIHLTYELPKVNHKAYKAAWTSITNQLPREKNEEGISALIDYLTLTEFPASIAKQDVNRFFFKDSDPQYLILKKTKLLCKLIDADNMESILSEFISHVKKMTRGVVKKMVQSLSVAVSQDCTFEGRFSEFMVSLIGMDREQGSQLLHSVVEVLPSVRLTDLSLWQGIVSSLCGCYQQLESTNARCSCIVVIGWHGADNPLTPDLLCHALDLWLWDEIRGGTPLDFSHQGGGDAYMIHTSTGQIQSSEDNHTSKLKLSFLAAMTRACLKWPAMLQHPLSQLLEMCVQDVDRGVRRRVVMLHNLLRIKAHGSVDDKEEY